ncbi:radical SAM protein [Chitinispirillales bacterium ANBcel5]|uniref:radical SAM protein n=1 Tax=Cellulosispirillum alkaliphilum TaxID=3039283 RepID=UPI002A506253|nr:radical SAM protein [Chitinispirillales bacterium ANBcel5]
MKRFIECIIPVTTCNLKCSYCYVEQQNRFSQKKQLQFKYSPQHIGEALSVKRLGGVSFVSLTGSGETLIPKEVPQIVLNILKQGHFVNLTTNGTLISRFEEIITLKNEYLERLHFSFSLHYCELKRTNKLETFFKNINMVKNAGCSYLVQVNMSDEYLPVWDEIKEKVIANTGALPQVALTRDESGLPNNYKILTQKPEEEYVSKSREADSPLFEFTLKNFMKKRKEFCYAGEWSAKLNIATGKLSGCYGFGIVQNIFDDLSKPIKFEAIGCNCPFLYCFNSSHFMSLGVIPSLWSQSYGQLRNRVEAKWHTPKMEEFLNQRLFDDNQQYTWFRKQYCTMKYRLLWLILKVRSECKRWFKLIVRLKRK